MTRALLAFVLVQAAPAVWAADGEPEAKTIHSSFYGDHGGTNPVTTGSVGEYMENGSKLNHDSEEGVPSKPPLESSSRPEAAPRAQFPTQDSAVTPRAQARQETLPVSERPSRMGAFTPRDPAAQRYYTGPAREKLSDAVADRPQRAPDARKGFSLWETVGAPVEINAARVGSSGIDEAEGLARQEYERRILGHAAGALAPGTSGADPLQRPAGSGPVSISDAARDVFVSVDVAGGQQEALKDAVAGLSNAAGFRIDPRFPPQPSDLAGPQAAARLATSLRGWIPADRLNAAVQLPGVLRVQVDRSGTRADGIGAAVTTLVVGLRIPEHASAGETFQRTIGELAGSAHFRWTRTVGFQAVPNSKDVALVVIGEIPVSRIPRLLEHPGVLKVGPAPLDESANQAPASAPSRLEQFLGYVRVQAPLLLALTLLLLLPSVGNLLLKVGQAFIPYQR